MGEGLNQPSRVKEEGPEGRKFLLDGSKGKDVSFFASTVRISIG